MIEVKPFESSHLPQLQSLINSHLSVLVPGWALPSEYIASRLLDNPDDFILNPWVIERRTFVAKKQGSIYAAAHLLRYGDSPTVSEDYKEAAELRWFLAWPTAGDSAAALLERVMEQTRNWQVKKFYATNILPVPVAGGLPEVWPHIQSFLEQAGFYTDFTGTEAVFGGDLPDLEPQLEPPVPGIHFERHLDRYGPCFKLFQGQEMIGAFSIATDLTKGGELPALSGWGELTEIWVADNWQNRGLGTWMMGHVVSWMRLAGVKRVLFSVASENESLGAGRFYRRFGWDAFVRQGKGWEHTLS